MASEILSVPEEHLADVIAVIRAGLAVTHKSNIKPVVLRNLARWCKEESDYLKKLAEP
jgi:hypothetical protein